MKVTILGFENTSYPDKSTGELREQITFSYSRPLKSEKGFGCTVGTEQVSAKAFPNQFALFNKLGEKIIGKTAIISKDVRKFKDTSYAILDELEIIN